MEPVEPVLKNMYQVNTYRKDLSWPDFNSEPRVQEKQQVKNQQSCLFHFVACLTMLDLIKAPKIIGQRKAFYSQTIPESSCARKETDDKHPCNI